MCVCLQVQGTNSTGSGQYTTESRQYITGPGQHRATLYTPRQYTYGSVQCIKLLPVQPIQGSATLNLGSAVLNQASTILRSILPGSVHLHLSIHQFAVCLCVQDSTALDQGSTVLDSTPRGSTDLDQGSTVQDQAVIHQALDTTTQFWGVSSQKQMWLPEEGQVCCAFSPAIQSFWTLACTHSFHTITHQLISHHVMSCSIVQEIP